MSIAFITNFKNMLGAIASSANTQKDCPVNINFIGGIIDYLFKDVSRHQLVANKFKENRTLINNNVYKSDTGFDNAIKTRDRTLFKHIELFPDNLRTTYKFEIEWFSSYITSRMPIEHMKHIWSYMEKLNKQA